jgi:hypothetical protein
MTHQTPHGGRLCELIPQDQALVTDLAQEAKTLKKLRLSQRQVCDLELLLNGGFSPLQGFLNKEDYERCVPARDPIVPLRHFEIFFWLTILRSLCVFHVLQCCRGHALEVGSAVADASHARRDGGEGFRCLATDPFLPIIAQLASPSVLLFRSALFARSPRLHHHNSTGSWPRGSALLSLTPRKAFPWRFSPSRACGSPTRSRRPSKVPSTSRDFRQEITSSAC